MKQRDARRAHGMRLHRGGRAHRVHLETEIRGRLQQIRGANVPDDERPAVEFPAGRLERLFGRIERCVLEPVAQRGERDVGVVVDDEHRAGAGHTAPGANLARQSLHRRVEHFHVGHADGLHVEQLGERPAGVVVRRPLRIVRAPVLVVHQ